MKLASQLDEFVDTALRIVRRHRLPTGGHSRFTLPDALGQARDGGVNAYGCADAVNILYSVDELTETRAHERSLIALQDEDGMFRERSHHPIHTTAHCAAALELLNARPARALDALGEWRDPARGEAFLEALDWKEQPWTEAHQGAGLYAALLLCDEIDAAWSDRYFDWLVRNFDAESGLLRRGCLPTRSAWKPAIFPHLAGTFHYLFNMEHAGVAHPFPEALIDTCLVVFDRELWPLASYIGFAEIDQVYCLHRAMRRTDHRRAEAEEALRSFADDYLGFLCAIDGDDDCGLDDLHNLFGAVCALSELQLALPEDFAGARTLRQVLDRRPFI